MGRPTKHSAAIEEKIIGRLIEGESLRRICEDEAMPDRRTVMRWMEADADFATKCVRARELQADLMDDKIIDAAEATTPENAVAQRVKIAAYQWRASKLAPKKYGDKLAHVGGGEDDAPIKNELTVRFV